MSSVKVIILLHLLSKVICDNIDNLDIDVYNENLFDSKNLLNDNVNYVLPKLLRESKFNSEIIKNPGPNDDTVNYYEDITILDDDGQLKNLKYKSADIAKSQLQKFVNSDIRLTKVSDKVNQIEVPVTNSDKVELKVQSQKPKFFDELDTYEFLYEVK
ncbi:unnamed protein product [Arctia plantaginis]|uniref:Uncharacterized protein n=1 Tax=Arctia plantaginis TaxID=874455 RepID=A0A8S1A6B5_ARCPL|nr:unnamed protein product [Arctia plantaginis]